MNTYEVIPGFVVVVDYGSTKTPRRVNTSACDGDGSQVNHEHCEPYWKGSQYLHKQQFKSSYTVTV